MIQHRRHLGHLQNLILESTTAFGFRKVSILPALASVIIRAAPEFKFAIQSLHWLGASPKVARTSNWRT